MFLAFIRTLGLIALMEIGDKTQLLAIAMTRKYKLRDIIVGILLSIILLNLIAVGAGSVINDYVPQNYISLTAGGLFIIFAFLTVFDNDCEQDCREGKCRLAILSVAGTFFLAELGDKTQFSAMSVAATEPGKEIAVFLGACAGLFLADIAGIMVGLLIGKTFPQHIIKWLTTAIFMFSGLITLYEPLSEWTTATATWIILAAIFAAVVCACVISVFCRGSNGNFQCKTGQDKK